jgi:predicted regulator of Ras-like GTPase activity (Roadblock/LC7/MglB family)
MGTNPDLARTLSTLRDLPGVVGSMACDGRGHVLGASFPPRFERRQVLEAALLLADATGALEIATGSVAMLDFRYEDARILVKPFEGGFLLLLCSAPIALGRISSCILAGSAELEGLLRGAA